MEGSVPLRPVSAYFRGASASLAAKALSMGSSLAALWLATRILGPGDFGAFAVAMAWVTLVALLATSGLDGSLLYVLARREVDATQVQGADIFRCALSGALVSGGVASLALMATGTLVDSFFQPGHVGRWLYSLAPIVPLSTTSAVFEAWYQSNHRVATMLLLPRTVDVARALLLGVALWWGAGPPGVVLAYLLSAAAAPVVWLALPDSRSLFSALRTPLTVPQFVYGFKLMLSRVINNLVERLDILMLGALAPAATAARFAVASRLANPVGAPKDLFGPVFTPRIRRLTAEGDPRRAAEEFRLVQAYYLCSSLALAFVVTLAAPWLLLLFPGYRAALPILLLLVAAYVSKMAYGPATSYLSMSGGSGTLLLITVVALLVMGGLNLLLIPLFAARGAAAGTVLGILLIQTLTAVLIYRRDRLVTMTPLLALMLAVTVGVLFLAQAEVLPEPVAAATLGLLFLINLRAAVSMQRAQAAGSS